MGVQEMERRFFELKGKFDVGAITEDEFKAEIAKLRFQDKQERWWMIGAQSGKWYVNEGARWIPGAPPREDGAPKTSEPTTSTPETLAAPSTARTTARAAPRAPVRPTLPQLPARPALPSPPITGPLLIAAAGFVALIVVFIAWVAIDLFVPSKPISSFFGRFTNPSASRVATPAPLTLQAAAAANNVPMMLTVGDQLLSQSRVEAAITQYQNAAQLAPTNPAPLIRWSRALGMRGQTQDALAKAQQAIARGVSDADAHAQLCRALLWNSQVDDAIKSCEKAVQLDGKNANAHAFLAEAYLHANRTKDAFAQSQLALQAAPNSAEAHRAQAWVFTIQGNKDSAFGEWKQTTVLEPDSYFRHYELGEALRVYLGNSADAVPEYQKSVGLYGAYIPAIHRLGLALLDVNKPQDAIPHFQRAITLDPKNAEGYVYLAIAFGKAGKCNQAIPYFELALKSDPNNSTAQRGLSDCKAGNAPALPPTTPPTVPLMMPTLAPVK